MPKRLLYALAVSAFLLVGLVGCGGTNGGGETPVGADYNVKVYDLPNGATVTCVVVYKAGVSCNWEAR